MFYAIELRVWKTERYKMEDESWKKEDGRDEIKMKIENGIFFYLKLLSSIFDLHLWSYVLNFTQK